MTERGVVLVAAGGALLLIALALAAMASLHERHYRDRRNVIGEARYRGLEGRLQAVEEILTEDRMT